MIPSNERQSILDDEHLRLLSIGYYILGGTSLFFGFIPLIYVALGALFIGGGGNFYGDQVDPAVMGWFFVLFGGAFALALWFSGALQLWTGRCLKHREARTLCLITAALTCISIPYGTAVGVFTFIVLRRRSVEMLFDPMYRASRVVEPHTPLPPPENLT